MLRRRAIWAMGAVAPTCRGDMALLTDITEPAIAALVDRFYVKARHDPMIGPVFNTAIADWDRHLHRLCDFCSSVMLTTGRHKGNPMAAHL
jgi:hemoglobin